MPGKRAYFYKKLIIQASVPVTLLMTQYYWMRHRVCWVYYTIFSTHSLSLTFLINLWRCFESCTYLPICQGFCKPAPPSPVTVLPYLPLPCTVPAPKAIRRFPIDVAAPSPASLLTLVPWSPALASLTTPGLLTLRSNFDFYFRCNVTTDWLVAVQQKAKEGELVLIWEKKPPHKCCKF